MDTGSWSASRSVRLIGLLVLTAVFCLTLAVRSGNIFDRPLLSHNEDATGHVLATMRAMNAAPPEVHKYLPIITLSQNPADRKIDNFVGASISDGAGNHFYVSFPPLGFAIPYLMFRTFGIEPDVVSLRLFSAVLGLLTTGLLYLLALELLRGLGLSERRSAISAALTALLMLMNSESLWIFGNVYWHHVLLAPLLLWSLLLIARILEDGTAFRHILLFLSLALACAVEWAAYPLAASIAVLGAYRWLRRHEGGAALLVIGIVAPVTALSFIVWHFSQVAGLSAYLEVLQNRPTSHRLHGGTIWLGVIAFATLYLPLGLLAASFALPWGRKSPTLVLPSDRTRRVVWPVLFCAGAASVESVVLLQHTVWYPYGSLPATIFALLVLLTIFIYTGARIRRLAWGTAACSIFWLAVYFVQNPVGLKNSAFGAQFTDLNLISRLSSPDEQVFANVETTLGIALATGRRNLVSYPTMPLDVPLSKMRAYLAKNAPSRQGKLFLFDIPSAEIPQTVWWPYTKSRVVERPHYQYGRLAAVVSFNAAGVTSVSARPDPQSRRALHKWMSRQGRAVEGVKIASLMPSL